MLPPLPAIKTGLERTTEALAAELALPGTATPDWSELDWQLAHAAAAAHGISPLLSASNHWRHDGWRVFLATQREHVALRHQRIAELLDHIDEVARAAGVALVPLKGSALHAMGIYTPGQRPMADIDLLVREGDARLASRLLQSIGYVESFNQWKHRVFKPRAGQPSPGLGEHCDTPVNIELHSHIHERLPVATTDITAQVQPPDAMPGLNPYPSTSALMSHLLLHAAGNVCNRSLRLIHMHDIALLARRMRMRDWQDCLGEHAGDGAWWALPPLALVARYYPGAIPADVIAHLETRCPAWLKAVTRRQTITRVSCSDLWLHALPGIEWSRSVQDVTHYLRRRLRPPAEAVKERSDMVRTQLWLQGQDWVTSSQHRRLLTWLTKPVPRMDTLYVVRAALEQHAA